MPNIIFSVASQYAGPLSFEQFFQDTVAEWEKLHQHPVRSNSTTDKRSTDAILDDPVRSRQVAAIDHALLVLPGRRHACSRPEAGKNRAYRD